MKGRKYKVKRSAINAVCAVELCITRNRGESAYRGNTVYAKPTRHDAKRLRAAMFDGWQLQLTAKRECRKMQLNIITSRLMVAAAVSART